MRPTNEHIMEKAPDLRAAIPNLNPTGTLNRHELHSFYVDRTEVEEQLTDITNLLELQYPCKLLLTGHLGVGKSSALIKLGQTLSMRGKLWVVQISLRDKLNLSDVDYTDIVFLLATEMLEKCLSDGLRLSEAIGKRLEAWGQEIEFVQQESQTLQASAEGKAEVSTPNLPWISWPVKALLSVSGRLASEEQTRKTIREQVKPKFEGLLEIIDDLQQAIYKQTNKWVVCLVDSTDKTSVEQAEELFYKNGFDLTAPQCSLVYTFPVFLQHSKDYNQVLAYFNDAFPIPNFKVQVRIQGKRTPGEEQRQQQATKHLAEIITKRVDENLFEAGTLEKLAIYSAGIPRELLRLTQAACLNGLRGNKVRMEDVDKAINKVRQAFQRLLSEADKDLLRKVRDTNAIDPNPEQGYLELLHNLSVVEYVNGGVWYDVHPIVRDLL